ncbi:MAG: putative sugar nucleotidyl transferase [Conexivisphaerales archaeon]
MRYAIFEEEFPNRMLPFSLTRPSFELIYRYRKLIEWYREKLGDPAGYLLPDRFKEKYGYETEDFDLVINSTLKPELLDKLVELKDGNSAYEGTRLVAIKGSKKGSEKIPVQGYLLQGPWELVKSINDPPYTKSRIEGKLESYTIIDDSKGPIIIEKNSQVEAFSKIIGPAYISSGSIIGPAIISSSFIGNGCRVSGELERSIVDSLTNKAHYGFFGDSYLGTYVNVGAGSTTSNLKNTYGVVKVKLGNSTFYTGEIKVGAFLGDFSRLSINTSIMAGKLVGAGAYVQGIVNKNVKPFTFFNRKGNIELIIEHIRRALVRRNIKLDRSLETLIRNAYGLVWRDHP